MAHCTHGPLGRPILNRQKVVVALKVAKKLQGSTQEKVHQLAIAETATVYTVEHEKMPNRTRIFLARHGETFANAEGLAQGGGTDSELNEVGRKQAAALREALRGVDLKAVYVSDLKRSKATAWPFRDDREAKVDARLNEMHYGDLEGRVLREVLSVLKDISQDWNSGNRDRRCPGGESPREVFARGLEALREIALKHQGQDVLCVSHSRFNKVLLSEILHGDISKMMMIPQDNTCVNVLHFQDDEFTVKEVNLTGSELSEKLAKL